MSPQILVSSTTYKTQVAPEKPCKKRQGILIGQLKDSDDRTVNLEAADRELF